MHPEKHCAGTRVVLTCSSASGSDGLCQNCEMEIFVQGGARVGAGWGRLGPGPSGGLWLYKFPRNSRVKSTAVAGLCRRLPSWQAERLVKSATHFEALVRATSKLIYALGAL